MPGIDGPQVSLARELTMSEPGKRHFQIAMDAIDELENTTSAGEAVDTWAARWPISGSSTSAA
jgi:hypothetical protein